MRYLDAHSPEGVRDELGFGAIHFAYSDRFFPGTSVLHARLRYIFFVAWSYQELLLDSSGEPFSESALRDIERRIAWKLMRGVGTLENSGISGWQRYCAEREPVVLASRIYWNALKVWGVLRRSPISGRPPNQSDLHSGWPQLLTLDEDSDAAKQMRVELFDKVPSPPPNWKHKGGVLDFGLTKREAEYVRRHWEGLGASVKEPTLISALVESGLHPERLWDPRILGVANKEDGPALLRARCAASIVGLGRALYAALVEQRRNNLWNIDDSLHAAHLERMAKLHRVAALSHGVEELGVDVGLNSDLTALLKQICGWARNGGAIDPLYPQFAEREHSLKNDRAFLLAGKERLETWHKAAAAPLDYRWPVVRRLLSDLADAT
jgi:hypothetical protein